jgi:acyl carrier protein
MKNQWCNKGNGMTRAEIFAALTKVFRDVFDDESITPRDDMTAADVEGWDSLSHIRLVVPVEEELGLRFETKEINDLKNVGDFANLIDRKLNG